VRGSHSGRDVWLAASALVAGLQSMPTLLAAQELRVHAEVDASRVGVEDQLQLSVTVEGGAGALGQDVPVPALDKLRVVGGPFVTTQLSLVNGVASQSKVVTWVLQPTEVGQARIGVVRIEADDAAAATDPIVVEVVPGQLRRPAARGRSRIDPLDPFGEDPFERFFQTRRRGPEPQVLMEAAASRRRVHVGEPVLVTYYLYTQTAVSDLQPIAAPQYPGFWAEDLPREGAPRGERAERGFQRFAVLRKLLFPTRAGTLTLPESRFRILTPRDSVFDPGRAFERATEPLTVEVQPLPEAPGFRGAVGRFEAEASLDKPRVALGEAATLRFRVKGVGNLKWVDAAPTLEIPGARVYPPQAKSDLRVTESGVAGERTWEFVVVPETGGTLAVPPMPFVYYDARAERLERLETASLSLDVAGAAVASGPAAAAGAAGAGGIASSLALRAELEPSRTGVPVLGARAVALALALALLAHAGIWAGGRLRLPGLARPGLPARPRTRQALADIERAGRGELSKEAAAALVERTLHDLFGPLEGEAAPDDARGRAARQVLREVQFLRYAPQLGDYSEKLAEVTAHAAELVRRWA
jgi:hypothetical protein